MLTSPAFKRRMNLPYNFDRRWDIPYLCGYSKNARKVFLDKHLRYMMTFKGRVYDLRKYLSLHERGEKALEDIYRLPYAVAHHLVTWGIEYPAVVRDGLSWEAYDKFLKPQIKYADHASIRNVPEDLDLKPYTDEHAKLLLKKMKKNDKKDLTNKDKESISDNVQSHEPKTSTRGTGLLSNTSLGNTGSNQSRAFGGSNPRTVLRGRRNVGGVERSRS
jgi:hypothetical protein